MSEVHGYSSHTVEHDPFVKSQLVSRNQPLMWCEFSDVSAYNLGRTKPGFETRTHTFSSAERIERRGRFEVQAVLSRVVSTTSFCSLPCPKNGAGAGAFDAGRGRGHPAPYPAHPLVPSPQTTFPIPDY